MGERERERERERCMLTWDPRQSVRPGQPGVPRRPGWAGKPGGARHAVPTRWAGKTRRALEALRSRQADGARAAREAVDTRGAVGAVGARGAHRGVVAGEAAVAAAELGDAGLERLACAGMCACFCVFARARAFACLRWTDPDNFARKRRS